MYIYICIDTIIIYHDFPTHVVNPVPASSRDPQSSWILGPGPRLAALALGACWSRCAIILWNINTADGGVHKWGYPNIWMVFVNGNIPING